MTTTRRRAYVGLITPSGRRRVVVMLLDADETFDLPLRPDLATHAHAFSWGEGGGAEARQLACSILADYFGPGREAAALERVNSFAALLAQLDGHAGFTLSHALIAQLLAGATAPASISTRHPAAPIAGHFAKG